MKYNIFAMMVLFSLFIVSCQKSNPVSAKSTEPTVPIVCRLVADTTYPPKGISYSFAQWWTIENISSHNIDSVGYHVMDSLISVSSQPPHQILTVNVDTIYTVYKGTILPSQKDTIYFSGSALIDYPHTNPWPVPFWKK